MRESTHTAATPPSSSTDAPLPAGTGEAVRTSGINESSRARQASAGRTTLRSASSWLALISANCLPARPPAVKLSPYQGRNTDTASAIAPSAETSRPYLDRSPTMLRSSSAGSPYGLTGNARSSAREQPGERALCRAKPSVGVARIGSEVGRGDGVARGQLARDALTLGEQQPRIA